MERLRLSKKEVMGTARRRSMLLAAAASTSDSALARCFLPSMAQLTKPGGHPAEVPFSAARSSLFVVNHAEPRSGSLIASSWAFLCLAEIANFAQLRRYLGAARADRLVFDIADRISGQMPQARLSAVGRAVIEFRFEGDEFEDGNRLLSRLHDIFETPLDLDGEKHRIDLDLAAAAAPTSDIDQVRLAEEAEAAIEIARSERRIVLRDLSVGTPAFDRLSLIRDLASAIPNGEMFLQYQPKVHVRRQRVDSVEALVRWQHPTRGLILPGDFIPAAEESRKIAALTRWTIDQVIADQQRLADEGHDLTIFVNISGQLLADPAFVGDLCAKLKQSGAKVGVEITETSVIRDPDIAISHLQQMAAIGIPIAIDDYGAGLSSLAYLKQLPACELKIDKMFIMQLTSSNRDPLIVRSTIDLAHALEMEVTAEGVETQAALALLSVMGCDIVQGFLISRPISIDALRKFLDDERHLASTPDPRGAFDRPASFWKSA